MIFLNEVEYSSVSIFQFSLKIQVIFLISTKTSVVLTDAYVQRTVETWRPKRLGGEKRQDSEDQMQVTFKRLFTKEVPMYIYQKKVVNEKPEVNNAMEALEENINK